MTKARGVDAKLARLRALRQEPDSPKARAELCDALGHKSNFVVAAAAEIVGERRLTDLAPDLVAVFHRFLVEPAETDKTCRAKLAVTEALDRMEADAEEVFRIGLRHVQPEPRWGGSDDTAAPLRGAAAFALVRLNPRDLMLLLADLLADPEKVARSAAVRALGGCGALAAIPLLRFKARAGDAEPEVVGECLSALMTAGPDGSVPFVGPFLDSPTEEIAEAAALALAESRRPDALALLLAHWPRANDESLRRVLLLAIAITRLPAGIDFLLDVLAEGDAETSSAAVSALAIHRHNPVVRDRVGAAIGRTGAAGRKQFEKEFRADSD